MGWGALGGASAAEIDGLKLTWPAAVGCHAIHAPQARKRRRAPLRQLYLHTNATGSRSGAREGPNLAWRTPVRPALEAGTPGPLSTGSLRTSLAKRLRLRTAQCLHRPALGTKGWEQGFEAPGGPETFSRGDPVARSSFPGRHVE